MMTKHVVDPMPRKTRSCSAALPVLNSKHGGAARPYTQTGSSLIVDSGTNIQKFQFHTCTLKASFRLKWFP
jgi:hypothetical protein